MTNLALDPAHSAVLSMDCQVGIVSIYAGGSKAPGAKEQPGTASETPPLLQSAAGVLKRARKAGLRVIHVRVGFRPNLPEIGARNSLFSAIKTSPQHQKLFQGTTGESILRSRPKAMKWSSQSIGSAHSPAPIWL